MITLIAVTPDQEVKKTALWKKIINGRYISDNASEILINYDTAKILDIHPGETAVSDPIHPSIHLLLPEY